jgi:hypothetical protein
MSKRRKAEAAKPRAAIVNYPPRPTKDNPGTRAAMNLSQWRRHPSETPKISGPLQNVKLTDLDTRRVLSECLERAGAEWVNCITYRMRHEWCSTDYLAYMMNTLVLDLELQAYRHRTRSDARPKVDVEQRYVDWKDALDTEAVSTDVYRELGQRVTARMYLHMWNAVAQFAKIPREAWDGDFEETLQMYSTFSSDDEYTSLLKAEMDSAIRVQSFLIFKHIAPDFDPASALEARLGTSSNATPLKLAELDKAGERGQLERAEALARDLDLGNSSQTDNRYRPNTYDPKRTLNKVEAYCASQDKRLIFEELQIVSERCWWESGEPVHYINSALRNQRVDRSNEEFSEHDSAEKAGGALTSLDDHPDLRDNRESAVEIVARLDLEKICDTENVPDDVRQLLRAKFRYGAGAKEQLRKQMSLNRIKAAEQKLKKSEFLGCKLAVSQPIVGFSGARSVPTGYQNTPTDAVRMKKK